MNKKKLVVLIDGTGNDKDDETTPLTNVGKFNKFLHVKDGSIFYSSGPATLGNDQIAGGLGFSDSIEEYINSAYKWLAKRSKYVDIDQNIYLMGFSRGAYIARALSWILYYAGLPDDPNDCKSRVKTFYDKDFAALKFAKSHDKVSLKDGDIRFLGVWDTVKSSSLPDVCDEKISPLVQKAFHAMALDECRKDFQVLKFEKDPRVQQMWFIGCHSDIGGGYKECELSDISCLEMVKVALKSDLSFRKSEMNTLHPNPLSEDIHDEYKNSVAWKLRGKECRVYNGEEIHSSAIERVQVTSYVPMCKNFPYS